MRKICSNCSAANYRNYREVIWAVNPVIIKIMISERHDIIGELLWEYTEVFARAPEYDRVTCSTSYINIQHGITWHAAGELRYMVSDRSTVVSSSRLVLSKRCLICLMSQVCLLSAVGRREEGGCHHPTESLRVVLVSGQWWTAWSAGDRPVKYGKYVTCAITSIIHIRYTCRSRLILTKSYRLDFFRKFYPFLSLSLSLSRDSLIADVGGVWEGSRGGNPVYVPAEREYIWITRFWAR